uniref:Uncharacterized protein n=1 Tax=Arundo donax TaxID=35708 RepID=A0A0A9DYE4_ARUDO
MPVNRAAVAPSRQAGAAPLCYTAMLSMSVKYAVPPHQD